MAIASFFVLHSPQDQKQVLETLGRLSQIVAIRPVDEEKTAASLELPGQELTYLLKKISAIPQILSLELIFVNYEDDLDGNGFMEIPPEAKKNE